VEHKDLNSYPQTQIDLRFLIWS